ncbi:MAG: RNA methyltransferase [Bacteroidales bacterium]|nr:RNA methyltransferase [Bacteroidales bacterium]
MYKDLIEYLSQFFTDIRFNQMVNVVNQRTEYIVPVLENIVQPQNTNAVIRSCECLGLNKMCLIENENKFSVYKDVDKGSSKWIDIRRYADKNFNTFDCINDLKSEGYRIVATSPHPGGVSLDDFNIFDGKCAILFGTEPTGLTDTALKLSDEFLTIPMCGFTESFNISVSAAIILYTLTRKLRNSDFDFILPENVRQNLLLEWIKKSLKTPDLIIERYNREHNTAF